MFDYPIPPLRAGLYGDLGLGPEATAEEISEAKQELSNRIKQQQKALRGELEEVYGQLPELRETYAQLKAMEGADSAADSEEYWKLQAKLTKLEEQAAGIRQDFKSLRNELEELEQQLHALNLTAIQNPEDRLEYDRSHPPFELIKLADCACSPLDDRKTVLRMIRTELSAFLEQAGETVFHPTDLTRVDFLLDFTKDATLDRKP